MKHFVKYLAFLVLLGACDGEEGPKPDSSAAYFPLSTGIYHIYAVQEIRYAGAQVEELNYELMTTVVDSFPASDGTYNYVIHRSQRSHGGEAWQLLDTWSARRTQSGVIVSEGNVPFVKIKFPVTEDTHWDGNAFNTLGEDEYALLEVLETKEIGGMIFDQTVTVEQERNEDFIVYRDERKEVYALGIGLVYKETLQLSYCTEDHCLGQQKIQSGIEMKIVIKAHGQN